MPDKPSGEKEGCIMDMKESLGPAAVFPLGEAPTPQQLAAAGRGRHGQLNTAQTPRRET